MDEFPVCLGPDQRLVGVVCEPDAKGSQIGCLLMNAGVIHRIGPHRLNVRIARALASIGIESVRVDLSGLGDTPHARDGMGFRERGIADLKIVMDYLERDRGIRRFIVVGICSGAVHGYWLTLNDPRVCGLLMFDGFAYPTLKTALVRRSRRLSRMTWPELRAYSVKTLSSLVNRSPRQARNGVGIDHPSSSEFRVAMDHLTDRGVGIYLLFTHSIEQYNYERQLHDGFRGARFLSRIQYAYIPHIDHAVTPLAAQKEFVDRVCSWASTLSASGDDFRERKHGSSTTKA